MTNRPASRDRGGGVSKPGHHRTSHIPISLSSSESCSSDSESGEAEGSRGGIRGEAEGSRGGVRGEAEGSHGRAAGARRGKGVSREGSPARGARMVSGRDVDASHHVRKSRIKHRKAANSNWPMPLSENSGKGGFEEGWSPHEVVHVSKVGGGLAKVDSWISEVEEVFGKSPGTIRRRQLISERKQDNGRSIWDDEEQQEEQRGEARQASWNVGVADDGVASKFRSLDMTRVESGQGGGEAGKEEEGEEKDEKDEEDESDEDAEEEAYAENMRIQIMTDYQSRCAKYGKSPVPLVSGALVSGMLPSTHHTHHTHLTRTTHLTHLTHHTHLTHRSKRPRPCYNRLSSPSENSPPCISVPKHTRLIVTTPTRHNWIRMGFSNLPADL